MPQWRLGAIMKAKVVHGTIKTLVSIESVAKI